MTLGSLIWLQVTTYSDLSFLVKLLLHFAHNLGKAHWNALKQVISYMKETLDYSITYYASKKLDPCGYIDSNFIEDKDTRRSTENHEFFIASGPVSKYQETIVISTVEAEYIAFICITVKRLVILMSWYILLATRCYRNDCEQLNIDISLGTINFRYKIKFSS